MRSLPWGDLLTSYDGQTITYDDIGNPLSDGTRTYTWEHGRELSSLTQNNITWNYTYDSNGMRTSRSDGVYTYEYVYNGDKLVQMITDGFTFDFTYDASGTPLTIAWDGTVYYYITNIQGDVTGIMTSTGEQIVSYAYTAWGEVTINSSDRIREYNPLLYRGYVYDFETKLYYLQSRYYDPARGRFLNADAYASTGQGLLGNNMFAYCFNSPCHYADYDGFRVAILNGLAQVNAEIFDAASSNPKDSPPDHPDFIPPKKGNKKVKNPNGAGWGWLDDKGNVWVWDPKMHGGPGWVIQKPGGGHGHAYPGGGGRNHFEAMPDSTNISIFTKNIPVGAVIIYGGFVVACVFDVAALLQLGRRVR